MDESKLSNRQLQIMEAISSFSEENELPPTVRDIQGLCNISSTSVVDYNLKILQKKGLVTRRKDVAHGIELSEGNNRTTKRSAYKVPVLGKIAAGYPLPVYGDMVVGSDEFDSEYIDVPGGISRDENLYGLRVEGTSMIDSCIDDGDVVIIKATDTAQNGQTVVAWLIQEEEATLKKIYFHENGVVRLQPANSNMAPIFVAADNISVRGTVVSVIREYC